MNDRSRYIPMPVRRKISDRSEGACEYVAPATGKRCASRFAIQCDHIDPMALGGKTTAINLRHFCDSHNKLAAIQAFGSEVMEQWLGKGKMPRPSENRTANSPDNPHSNATRGSPCAQARRLQSMSPQYGCCAIRLNRA